RSGEREPQHVPGDRAQRDRRDAAAQPGQQQHGGEGDPGGVGRGQRGRSRGRGERAADGGGEGEADGEEHGGTPRRPLLREERAGGQADRRLPPQAEGVDAQDRRGAARVGGGELAVLEQQPDDGGRERDEERRRAQHHRAGDGEVLPDAAGDAGG